MCMWKKGKIQVVDKEAEVRGNKRHTPGRIVREILVLLNLSFRTFLSISNWGISSVLTHGEHLLQLCTASLGGERALLLRFHHSVQLGIELML